MRRRRTVLLQVRVHPEARDHERLCFLEAGGLAAEELLAVDLVRDERFSWRDLGRVDAVFIGGSGEYSATRDYPFTGALLAIVRAAVDSGKPLLGSCWGHHFLARALGAEVITDRGRGEVGTFDVELTGDGEADPLLAGSPRRFAAHLGHHDRVATLPRGMRELAFSDRCPVQILRIEGRPAYGTQFHAEMNEQHMRSRVRMYREYLPDGQTVEEFSARLRPTPVAAGLLRRFLDLYL